MPNTWKFQLFNYYRHLTEFSKQKTSPNTQKYLSFDNQQINKNVWTTFKLLKTYLLFILFIRKTCIALPKLLL